MLQGYDLEFQLGYSLYFKKKKNRAFLYPSGKESVNHFIDKAWRTVLINLQKILRIGLVVSEILKVTTR